MTHADEVQFIALWTQGIDTAAMAQRLGIAVGTVYSRVHRLQQQG
jgi:transposase